MTLVLSEPAHLGEVPTWQRTVFRATRGREVDLDALGAVRPDIIVDALIGYGLREASHGRVAELIAWANTNGARRLALDVPSGLNATSGETPGVCIRAHATLTLALPKTGLGAVTAGDLWLADIGIPRATYERAGVPYADPFGVSDRVRIQPWSAPAPNWQGTHRSDPQPEV